MREELTSFLWKTTPIIGDYYLHWCEACECGHVVNVPPWAFNGDIYKPTFTPSVRLYDPGSDKEPKTAEKTLCHYNITNGTIIYHADSPHKFAGTMRMLAPIPKDYGFG